MRRPNSLPTTSVRYLVLAVLVGIAWLQGYRPALAQAPSDDRPVLVADVQIHGNHDISTERILQLIRTAPGQEFDQAVVDADVEMLRASGLFDNVYPAECTPVGDEEGQIAKNMIVHFHVVEPMIINEVRIEGNKLVPTENILAVLKTKAGSALSLSNLGDDVRAVVKLGGFRNVSCRVQPGSPSAEHECHGPYRPYLVACFQVAEFENPVKELVIKNNRHVKLDDLHALKRIKEGQPLNPGLNLEAQHEIELASRDAGYFFAGVTLEEGGQATDSRVVFNIAEGPRVRVRDVSFHGASEGGLQWFRKIVNSALRWPADAQHHPIFHPGIPEGAVGYLEDFCRYCGHFDAKVSVEKTFSSDSRWVDLTYHVDEGVRFRVKEVVVEGMPDELQQRAESMLQLRAGELYNHRDINADLKSLRDLLAQQGSDLQVWEVRSFPEPGAVSVQYKVGENVYDKLIRGEVLVLPQGGY